MTDIPNWYSPKNAQSILHHAQNLDGPLFFVGISINGTGREEYLFSDEHYKDAAIEIINEEITSYNRNADQALKQPIGWREAFRNNPGNIFFAKKNNDLEITIEAIDVKELTRLFGKTEEIADQNVKQFMQSYLACIIQGNQSPFNHPGEFSHAPDEEHFNRIMQEAQGVLARYASWPQGTLFISKSWHGTYFARKSGEGTKNIINNHLNPMNYHEEEGPIISTEDRPMAFIGDKIERQGGKGVLHYDLSKNMVDSIYTTRLLRGTRAISKDDELGAITDELMTRRGFTHIQQHNKEEEKTTGAAAVAQKVYQHLNNA